MKEPSVDEVLAALEAAGTEHPDLSPLLDFRRELLVAQRTVAAPPLSLDAATVRARLQAGQPALVLDDLSLDQATFTALLRRVEQVVQQHWPDRPMIGTDLSLNAVRAWYAGEGGLDQRAASLIAEALHPFLTQVAKAVRPDLDGVEWYREYCPACGGGPDFAVLERESGARYLLCSRCDTRWRYKRLGCPFCGNEDQCKLAYYPSEDQVYRLYVCDGCRRYLKAIDLRQTNRKLLVPLERLLTTGMDLAAREKDYRSTEVLI